MFSRFVSRSRKSAQRASSPSIKLPRRRGWGLRPTFEQLETRNLMTVTLDPAVSPSAFGLLHDYAVLDGKYMYLPLHTVDSDGKAITYNIQSTNPAIQTQVLGGTKIDLHVTGVDANSVPFDGHIIIQTFDTLAPATVAHITALVNQDFYDGKTFFRILDNFMAQTGSPTNNGQGGSNLGTFDDEFTTQLTFNSPGLVAMANGGPDTQDSQFFITQTGADHTNPTGFPTTSNEALNFKHAIFGQMVSGFDIYQAMMGTPVGVNTDFNNEVSKPSTTVTLVSASIITTDTQDAILQIFVPKNFATNTSTITVTATNTDSVSDQKSFVLTGQVDTFNDKPFIGPVVNNVNTNAAGTVSFQVPLIDINTPTDPNNVNDPNFLNFTVVDPVTLVAPTNATVSWTVNRTTGIATVQVVPNANFVGTLNLLAVVSNQSNFSTFDSERIAVNVGIFVDGTTLHVGGSSANDSIVVSYSGSNVLITLNGTQQTRALAGLTQIAIDGVAGIDTANITGNPNFAETAEMTGFAMTVTSSSVPLSVAHAPIIYFTGQAADTVNLHGIAGARETFVATQNYAKFTSPFFINQAFGAGRRNAFSSGDDSAKLYSATGVKYVATSSYGSMEGANNLLTKAVGFRKIEAVSAGSSSEIAYMYTAPNMKLVSQAKNTRMTGGGVDSIAQGFKRLNAVGSGSGSELAYFYGTGNSTSVTKPGDATLTAGSVVNKSTGFRNVIAVAKNSGDKAYLYDSTGNDNLWASGKQAWLKTSKGTATVNGYSTVRANSTQGDDFKSVAAIDFVLNATGNWQDLVSTGGQDGNR